MWRQRRVRAIDIDIPHKTFQLDRCLQRFRCIVWYEPMQEEYSYTGTCFLARNHDGKHIVQIAIGDKECLEVIGTDA